jgi:hypothetical protein
MSYCVHTWRQNKAAVMCKAAKHQIEKAKYTTLLMTRCMSYCCKVMLLGAVGAAPLCEHVVRQRVLIALYAQQQLTQQAAQQCKE